MYQRASTATATLDFESMDLRLHADGVVFDVEGGEDDVDGAVAAVEGKTEVNVMMLDVDEEDDEKEIEKAFARTRAISTREVRSIVRKYWDEFGVSSSSLISSS